MFESVKFPDYHTLVLCTEYTIVLTAINLRHLTSNKVAGVHTHHAALKKRMRSFRRRQWWHWPRGVHDFATLRLHDDAIGVRSGRVAVQTRSCKDYACDAHAQCYIIGFIKIFILFIALHAWVWLSAETSKHSTVVSENLNVSQYTMKKRQ